jgi:hypothetical protein
VVRVSAEALQEVLNTSRGTTMWVRKRVVPLQAQDPAAACSLPQARPSAPPPCLLMHVTTLLTQAVSRQPQLKGSLGQAQRQATQAMLPLPIERGLLNCRQTPYAVKRSQQLVEGYTHQPKAQSSLGLGSDCLPTCSMHASHGLLQWRGGGQSGIRHAPWSCAPFSPAGATCHRSLSGGWVAVHACMLCFGVHKYKSCSMQTSVHGKDMLALPAMAHSEQVMVMYLCALALTLPFAFSSLPCPQVQLVSRDLMLLDLGLAGTSSGSSSTEGAGGQQQQQQPMSAGWQQTLYIALYNWQTTRVLCALRSTSDAALALLHQYAPVMASDVTGAGDWERFASSTHSAAAARELLAEALGPSARLAAQVVPAAAAAPAQAPADGSNMQLAVAGTTGPAAAQQLQQQKPSREGRERTDRQLAVRKALSLLAGGSQVGGGAGGGHFHTQQAACLFLAPCICNSMSYCLAIPSVLQQSACTHSLLLCSC